MQTPRKPDTPILAGLICFGIAAIVLGMMHLGRVIKTPRATVGTYQSSEELDAQQRIALATLDTDKDTLPDLDELERTFTSPYLADSDSDGVDDAKELSAGTDPNCPTGQECAAIFRAEAGPAPSTSGGNTDASSSTSSVLGGLPTGGSFDPLRLLTGALGGSGFSPSEISNQQSAISNPSTPPFDMSALLKNLPQTPDAIRAALKQNGIPGSQLNAIDDATLMELWQKSLQDLKTVQPPK